MRCPGRARRRVADSRAGHALPSHGRRARAGIAPSRNSRSGSPATNATQSLVLAILQRLGLPFDRYAGRRLRAPARAFVTENLDGLQVPHELREVLEVPPERVHLFD